MRIKVLHTEWSDGWGGQEQRIIGEISLLKDKIDFYLACRKDSKILKKAKEIGIPIFILPFKNKFDFKTIFELIKIIKNNEIDIVHTHSGIDTWIGGLASKIAGAKFIRTRHLSNPINKSRLNFINELADFIITTGESIKQNMIKDNRINKNKIISIPTGQDSNRFNPNRYNKSKSRQILNLPNDKIIIGNLAILRKFKRHDIFIKVAKKVTQKYQNVLFVIAGDGPQKDNLLKMIKEYQLEKNVKLIGFCNRPEIFLSSIDIFLFTSDSNEGVPQVLIQALMMNLSVISSNVGSIKDLWHNNNFDLIDNYTIENFAKTVIKNLENPQKKDTREYMVKNFSTNIMAENILDVYNRVIKNGNI